MPRVKLLPDTRTFEIRSGGQLLTAAWKNGVGIKSICGGRGKCGSCIIKIESDAPFSDALNRVSDAEKDLLPDVESDRYRLACLCEVNGDITISVPPESQVVKNAPRKPFTHIRTSARPVVARVEVSVDGAYSAPPRSLQTRVSEAIAKTLGRRSVELSPEVMADYSLTRGFDAAKKVTATVYRDRKVIHLTSMKRERLCGLAIDIGTTSVVVFLCDLTNGEILATRTATNPQGLYGEDVISRKTHIQGDIGALREMRRVLVDELNAQIGDACSEAGIAGDDIVDAVVVGNPTMQHILLGINPESLGRGPYLPVWSEGVEQEAINLGLEMAPRARVFVFPMNAAYIGGDTLAAVLTRGADYYRGTHLLVDIGTNGEVVLAHGGELFATSCATGPVYEGAHIRCGIRATPGAIERVWVDLDKTIRWAVIPSEDEESTPRPLGLCGSGVISTIASLTACGLIGEDGMLGDAAQHPHLRINQTDGSKELLLVPANRTQTGRDIVLTQQDIRAVQLGKSALRTGIEILLDECGVKQLDRIYLAGTFGNHLEPEDILRIGMVPPVKTEHIRSIGNAAGDGARMALFNRRHRKRAVNLARKINVLELSGRPEFNDLFILHTNLSSVLNDTAA